MLTLRNSCASPGYRRFEFTSFRVASQCVLGTNKIRIFQERCLTEEDEMSDLITWRILKEGRHADMGVLKMTQLVSQIEKYGFRSCMTSHLYNLM